MNNVQFDEEQVNTQYLRKNEVYSGLIGSTIKMRLAKNEVQANIVLIVIILACIAGTVFILAGESFSKPTNLPQPLTNEQFRDLMTIRR